MRCDVPLLGPGFHRGDEEDVAAWRSLTFIIAQLQHTGTQGSDNALRRGTDHSALGFFGALLTAGIDLR
jgi:hypothetical protein